MELYVNNQELRIFIKDILKRPEFHKNDPNLYQKLMDKINHWLNSNLGGSKDASWLNWLGKFIELIGWPAFIMLGLFLLLFIVYGIFKLKKLVHKSGHFNTNIVSDEIAGLTPEQLINAATELISAGNYRGGLRLHYQALLLELDQDRLIGFRSSKTNREYASEISINCPGKIDFFRQFLNLYERIWYGAINCSQQELTLGLSLLSAMREGKDEN